MKIKLMLDNRASKTQIICYKVEGGWSTFGADMAIISRHLGKAAERLLKEELDIPPKVFQALYKDAEKARRETYRGHSFPKGVPDDMKNFFLENLGQKVQVILRKGHEEFRSDILECGADGRTHIFTVGRSTGPQKILLATYSDEPFGGEISYSSIGFFRSL